MSNGPTIHRATLHALAIYGKARPKDIAPWLLPELRPHLERALDELTQQGLVTRHGIRYRIVPGAYRKNTR